MGPDLDPEALERERARRRKLRQQQVQRRRAVAGVFVLALIVVIIVIGLTCSGGKESTSTTQSTAGTETTLPSAKFTAKLTGGESVPPVKTQAAAVLTLEYDAESKKLTYVLEVTSAITNPSTAAIYQGTPGTSGTTVYILFAGPMKEGSFVGVLAEGEIVESDLIGPLRGGTLGDLINLINNGKAYVSIGNKSHPVDAIRGQIEPAQEQNQ